jgi:PAS domain S-box-containing protein
VSNKVDIIKDMSLLYELSLAVGESIELKENVAHFLQTLIERKNLSFASIWIHAKHFSDNKQEDYLCLIGGFPKFQLKEKKLSEDHDSWQRLQHDTFFSVHHEDADFEQFIQEESINQGAIAFLRLDDLGFIKMYDQKRKEPFNALELNKLKQVIKKLATSLKGSISQMKYKTELKEKTAFATELDKRKSYLQSINAFAATLLSSDSLHDIAKQIIDSVINQLGFEDCIIYTVDEKTGNLWQAAAFGPKDMGNYQVANPILIPIGQGIVGSVAQTGKAELISDTSQDPRYIVDDAIRYSELAVPILSDGKVIGVIDSEHSEKNFFTEEHKETLLTIAGLTATKIRNALWRSQQEETQLALAGSEKKLRSIINSALDAVVTIDKESNVTEWNSQAEEMFGWTRGEVMGKPLRDFIIPHSLRDAHQDGMKNFYKTGHGPVLNKRIEVPALHKSGRQFPVELSIVPLKIKGKYAFSAFLRDITEQKEAVEKRERLVKKLEKANSELQDFAYVVSHDLKAPLRAIGSLAHWIEEDYGEKLDGEGIEQLQMLQGRVTRMNELINGILDFSRAGQNDKEIEVVDLNQNLVKTIYLVHLPDHIEIKIVGDWPHVKINKTRILQVFQNLISNAIKYMDKPRGSIEVGVNNREKDWLFWVKDNGPGIEEKYHEKIFRIFQTLNPRDEVESTGIGLSIVKKIIDAYGGEVWLESQPKKGSTFFFTLPHSIGA